MVIPAEIVSMPYRLHISLHLIMASSSSQSIAEPKAAAVSYSGLSVGPTGHLPSLTSYSAPQPKGQEAHAYFFVL